MAEEIFDDELSPKELAELSKLVDPDKPTEGKYDGWDQNFQREILSLIMNDRSFMLESVALLKAAYFTDEIHARIAGILFEHFDRYKTIPNKTIIIHELKQRLADQKDEIKARNYAELTAVIEYYKPGTETRDYYRDQIVNFAKGMALKAGIKKVFDLIKEDPNSSETWAKIGIVLKEAQAVERDFNVGLDYFNTAEERYERRADLIEKGDIFTVGFQSIDHALKNRGLLRGEMGSFMGLSGTGKSLALVAAALANLYKGHKVLYISLEIDQDAVAERFDAQLADPERTHGLTTSNLMEHRQIVFDALREFVGDYKDEEKQRLVIKQFPGGQMGVAELRAYYSQITMHGFRPDLVIIDYIGEMKDYPGVKTHESRYMIVRDLRGFAVEEQVCMLTAMQPNRSGKEANRMGLLMDEENLGDSMAQIRPLDGFWSIAQTQEEKEASVARINVAKHREGKSKFWFHIQFDYNILSMREISPAKYEAIMKKHRSEREVDNLEFAANQIEAKTLIERRQAKAAQKKEDAPKGTPPLANWKNDRGAPEEDVPDEPEEAPA